MIIIKKELKKKYFVVEKADNLKDLIAIHGPMTPGKAKQMAELHNKAGKFTYSSHHTGSHVETMLNSSYYNYIETLETELDHLLEN